MERQDQRLRGESRDLSKLSLEELLDQLAQASDDNAYAEALEQEILSREADSSAFFPDVEEQWETFQALYLPMAEEEVLGEGASLQYSPDLSAEVPEPVPRKRVSRTHRVWRTVVAAVIAAACMAAAVISGQMIGVDVFGARLRWTGDLFSFGRGTPESDTTESWEEMLLDNGPEPEDRV